MAKTSPTAPVFLSTGTSFVRGEREVEAEPLAMISTLLRADKSLTPQSAAMLDDLIKVAYKRLKKDA